MPSKILPPNLPRLKARKTRSGKTVYSFYDHQSISDEDFRHQLALEIESLNRKYRKELEAKIEELISSIPYVRPGLRKSEILTNASSPKARQLAYEFTGLSD
jgi:hypothetical protein